MLIKEKKAVDEKAVAKFISNDKPVKKVRADNMCTIAFKVDEEFASRIDRAAKKMGIPRASFIKSVISSALENGFSFKVSKD